MCLDWPALQWEEMSQSGAELEGGTEAGKESEDTFMLARREIREFKLLVVPKIQMEEINCNLMAAEKKSYYGYE